VDGSHNAASDVLVGGNELVRIMTIGHGAAVARVAGTQELRSPGEGIDRCEVGSSFERVYNV